MKLSVAVLVAAATATEKKVPPRHPIQRLNSLVELTNELMTDWFDFLPSQQAWITKFETNAERMQRNFERGNQRCGFYDAEVLPHGGPRDRRDVDEIRYNRDDPKEGVKQLTTGFRKWAERYLSECSGQKNYQHQVKRMERWNDTLRIHLEIKEKGEECGKDRMFIGGVTMPNYLSVSQWRTCVDQVDMGAWSKLCKPEKKPNDCPQSSWDQLFGECVVSEFSYC